MGNSLFGGVSGLDAAVLLGVLVVARLYVRTLFGGVGVAIFAFALVFVRFYLSQQR